MKAERYFQISTTWLVAFCFVNVLITHRSSQAQEINTGKSDKPDVRVKVNKEFDDKGNLTRYDSAYFYSWSGTGQIPFDADSFHGTFPRSFRFDQDSAIYPPFGLNDKRINDFFKLHSEQGFKTPEDSVYSYNKFKEFFQHHQALVDSFYNEDPLHYFEKEFEEMMKQNQRLMDQFFNQNPFRGKPRFENPPKDTIQQAPTND